MGERLCRCGQPMKNIRMTVKRNIDDRKVTIKNVPALSCDNCHEVLYNAKTIKNMDSLMRSNLDQKILTYSDPSGLDKEMIRFFTAIGLLEKEFTKDPESPISQFELIALTRKVS